MNLSCKGKLLIANPSRYTDFFSRSVILMIEHNQDGAFGFVLNKKLDTHNQFFFNDLEMFDGGPVNRKGISFIFKGEMENSPTNYLSLGNSFYYTQDLFFMSNAIATQMIDPTHIKMLRGYCGWSPTQLEEEIKSNYWNIAEHYLLDYTIKNTENLWKNMMENLGGEHLIWANTPTDISMN